MTETCQDLIGQAISLISEAVPSLLSNTETILDVLQNGIYTLTSGTGIRIIGGITLVIFGTVISFIFLLAYCGLISYTLAAVLSLASIIYYYFSFVSVLAFSSSYTYNQTQILEAQVAGASGTLLVNLNLLFQELVPVLGDAIEVCFA